MGERRIEQVGQRSSRLAGGIDKGLEQRGDERLDLGVMDNLSEPLETGVGGLSYLRAGEQGQVRDSARGLPGLNDEQLTENPSGPQ